MSIEAIPELDLDSIQVGPETESAFRDALDASIERESHSPLVTFTTRVEVWAQTTHWERIKQALLSARASNVSALLCLRKGDVFLEDDDITAIFSFLKEWDQFTLHNFLQLCEDWVPNTYQPLLQNEAKLESKWFQEWLSAASDSRIHKYPGLPWRSYVRKVVGENFVFATKFMELTAHAATPENIKAVQSHFMDFLESKKKVLCMFPKHWNRGSA